MQKTVYLLPLSNGAVFAWTLIGGSQRVPLVEYAVGHMRPPIINNKEDRQKLLDVLDAVMDERRTGTYPVYVDEECHRVVKAQVDVEQGEAPPLFREQETVLFYDRTSDMPLDYYQRCIDEARRALV